MKKICYLLLCAAAAVTVSCTKEPAADMSDPALGGDPVSVTFRLNLSNVLTKADSPTVTALDDGLAVNRVYAAIFAADGSLISTSRIGGDGFEPVIPISDGAASAALTVSKGQNYRVVFFAQKDETYKLLFSDGNVASFSYDQPVAANDPSLDAFFATMDFNGDATTYDVTLKRPFAQVNVLVPSSTVPAGKTA